MEESALLAPHLVVAFHASIRALGDDEVSQNVHINLPLDVVSDFSENQPRSTLREVDIIGHICGGHDHMLQRDVVCARTCGAASHFRSQEAGFVAFDVGWVWTHKGIRNKNGLGFRVRFQDLGELLGLSRGRRLQHLEIVGHLVVATIDHNHFGMWQNGHIIIDVVSHMPNPGSTYAIKAGFLGVGGQLEVRRGEEDELLLALFPLISSLGLPLGTFPILMAWRTIASTTLEWLAAISEEEVVALPICIQPLVVALNVGFTHFNEDTPLSIVEVGALISLALRLLDDGGAVVFHELIKESVVNGGEVTIPRPVDGDPHPRFSSLHFLPEWELDAVACLLTNQLEGGQEVRHFLVECKDVENSSPLVLHDLDVGEVASLLGEPLDHHADINAPLAGHAALTRKIKGEFLDHRHGDEKDDVEEDGGTTEEMEEARRRRRKRGGNGGNAEETEDARRKWRKRR